MTDAPVPVRPAATVILGRDGPSGFEVLLVRRHSDLAFHGGAWVFPGGRIDPGDYASGVQPDDLSHRDHEEAARAAAIREAHEEAGLLGEVVALVPFSHWTTPPGPPRRFATWFFLAVAPAGTVATDGAEITEHRWFAPVDALRLHAAGEIELPPPTFVSLTRLAGAGTVADALDEARTGAYIRFEPRLHPVDGGFVSLYDGDVAYDDLSRLDDDVPRHRLWAVPGGWRYERRPG